MPQSYTKENVKELYRWHILLIACIVQSGAYICGDFPAILESQLKSDMQISLIQYNLLFSIQTIPNIIIPIFSGFIVYKIGSSTSLLYFTLIQLIGQYLCTYAIIKNNYNELLLGRFISGMTGDSQQIALTILIAQWFKGTKLLGLALVLPLTFSRICTMVSSIILPELYDTNRSLASPLNLCLMVCIICFLLSYFVIKIDELLIKEDSEQQAHHIEQNSILESLKDTVNSLSEFNSLFWICLIFCSLEYAIFLPQMMNIQGLLYAVYKIPNKQASVLFAVPLLFGALTAPFVGTISENIGKRTTFLIASALFLLLAQIIFIIGIPSGNSCILNNCLLNALIPIMCLGFYYSFFSGCIWTCFTIINNIRLMSIGQGLLSFFSNICKKKFQLIFNLLSGLLLNPIFIGAILELTQQNYQYFWVTMLFLILSLTGLFFAILLYFLDKKKYNILHLSYEELNRFQIIKYDQQSSISSNSYRNSFYNSIIDDKKIIQFYKEIEQSEKEKFENENDNWEQQTYQQKLN